jgi:hypothetical protein
MFAKTPLPGSSPDDQLQSEQHSLERAEVTLGP